MKLYQVLLILSTLLFFISLLPLKFQIRYVRENKDDELIVKIFVIKWLVFKIEFPFLKLEKHLLDPHLKVTTEAEGLFNKDVDVHLAKDKERINLPPLEKIPRILSLILEKIKLYKPLGEYMLKRIRLKSLSWKTEFGLGDPLQTGILTGTIWSAKNLALTNITRMVKVNHFKPKLQVVPQFNKSAFNSDIYCIFDIRIGHIIITGINFVIRTLFKGGKADGGASYRRPNENSNGKH